MVAHNAPERGSRTATKNSSIAAAMMATCSPEMDSMCTMPAAANRSRTPGSMECVAAMRSARTKGASAPKAASMRSPIRPRSASSASRPAVRPTMAWRTMMPCFDATASPDTRTVAPAGATPARMESDAGMEQSDHEAVAGMKAPGAAGCESVIASAASRRSSHNHARASETPTRAAPAQMRCASPSQSPAAYAATAWTRRGTLETGSRWMETARVGRTSNRLPATGYQRSAARMPRIRRYPVHSVQHEHGERGAHLIALQIHRRERSADVCATRVARARGVERIRQHVGPAVGTAADCRILLAQLVKNRADGSLELVLHQRHQPASGSGRPAPTNAPVNVDPVVPV